MRADPRTLVERARSRASKITHCRFRVVAIGLDNRGRFIDIATNLPRSSSSIRNVHAEQILIGRNPRSLSTIVLVRFGRSGNKLPIHACARCAKLAERRGISIINNLE